MNYFTGSDFLPKLDEHAFGLRHPEEIQVHVEDPSDQDGVDGVSEHLYSELASYAFKPSKQFTNPFGLEDIREVDEDSILWSDGTHDSNKQYHKARRQYHAYIRTEDDSFPRRNGHLQSPTLPMFLSHSTQPRFHDRKPSRIWPLLSSLSPWSLKSFSIWRRFGLGNSQALWLTLYFLFNLLLTLSNKSVLLDFPFPYTLTAFHALVCSIGGYFLRSQGYFVPKPLKFRQEMVLAAFSVLYAINIAVSNVSLNMVTVPFHQVVRAVTPVFTIIISTVLLDARTARMKITSLAPVILGVAFATYGDYYFTLWGLLLTLLGTILAALKTIYTNILQSSSRSTPASPTLLKSMPRLFDLRRHFIPPSLGLHSLDLLTRMSPLAFIQCVVFAQMSGELDRLRHFGHIYDFGDLTDFSSTTSLANTTASTIASGTHGLLPGGFTWSQITILLLNATVAFGLNVVSFTANGKVGALSMTVAANVKQVLTILFAVSMFNLTITPMNIIGIILTLLGGAWYASVEYAEKKQSKSRLTRRG